MMIWWDRKLQLSFVRKFARRKFLATKRSCAPRLRVMSRRHASISKNNMFSGIVETEGKCKRVRIQKPRGWKLDLGESISVDGICSTIASTGQNYFEVEYMPQTLSKTTAALFEKGAILNLEHSLKYGDRIHGHFVAGHVDIRARVVGIEKDGRSRLVRVQLPRTLSRYVVSHGSIAVNGVSLTVARKSDTSFTVALIPHTLEATNLANLKTGDAVNIECDVLARS